MVEIHKRFNSKGTYTGKNRQNEFWEPIGDHKSIGNGIQELRLAFGPGYRVYFVEKDDIIIILLCGGDKSSQNSDIKNAMSYWQELKERSDE